MKIHILIYSFFSFFLALNGTSHPFDNRQKQAVVFHIDSITEIKKCRYSAEQKKLATMAQSTLNYQNGNYVQSVLSFITVYKYNPEEFQ